MDSFSVTGHYGEELTRGAAVCRVRFSCDNSRSLRRVLCSGFVIGKHVRDHVNLVNSTRRAAVLCRRGRKRVIVSSRRVTHLRRGGRGMEDRPLSQPHHKAAGGGKANGRRSLVPPITVQHVS